MNLKEKVGSEIASRVKDGEVIGVGSGTTVDAAIRALGERVKNEGLSFEAVPTSHKTAVYCAEMGLKVLSPVSVEKLSWSFDGADEVDKDFRLIKGRGAAMLQEKILAVKSEDFCVIVDESKLVNSLGEKFPVPLEVIPEALPYVKGVLSKLGATEVAVRESAEKNRFATTDSGNCIIDARFSKIEDSLEGELSSIVGVVESGLFVRYATEILVAHSNGNIESRKPTRDAS